MTVEEDARKRCPEWLCDCGGRCRKAMIGSCDCGGRCRKAMLGLCPESSTHVNKQGENQRVFDRTHASNCTHPKVVGHRFRKHHLKLLCSH